MSLALYSNPLSPSANKCAIALDEKSIAYERRTPLTFAAEGEDAELYTANPYAEVPALIDDGFAIFEFGVIFDYLEHRFLDRPLTPADPRERARALIIEQVMDARYDPIDWEVTELIHLGRVTGAQADAVRAASERRALAMNAWLEGQLDGRHWFGGDAFGAADIFVGVQLNGAAGHGLIEPASPLAAWLERVNGRGSFGEARRHGQAFMATLTPESLARWMGIPRPYRDARLKWVVKIAGVKVIAEGLAAGRLWFSHKLPDPAT